MSPWQERRILILGTTYPSQSKTYYETVCTGGLFDESFEMVRLYPVPMRYLDSDQRFKKFQWIRASVMKDPSDPRPESYKINPNSIELDDVVTDASVRRGYLEKSPHLVQSLEVLKVKQQTVGTSLGIVRPKDVLDCFIRPKAESERSEWDAKEKARLSQHRLFGDAAKPLAFPEVEFNINWNCNDPNCPSHTMHILQWGIHELYRKLKAKGDSQLEEKVIEAMHRELDESTRDVFLFLGNFRAVMYNFGLMDSYSPPKRLDPNEPQFSLFKNEG